MFKNRKSNTYSLRKSRKIFRHIYNLYRRKKKKISDPIKKRFENLLTSLQKSLLKEDKEAANRACHNLEKLAEKHLQKTAFDQIFDVFFAVVFALVIAILIRQMWFELYTIPTGSMRPTLKENDMIIVSKTDYGINVPLKASHFYFDPNLINRGSIIVFTGSNMDIRDVNTMYFYLIPGKKQFIKRLIGKPGDILYFYGGQIYGIDSQGNELKDLHDIWFEEIEHIPFIHFYGKVITPSKTSQNIFSPVIFYQMNEPVASLKIEPDGKIQSEMLITSEKEKITDYYDIWGMKNFAMARIIDHKMLYEFSKEDIAENTDYYLELTHHPSLEHSKIIRDEYGRLRPSLSYNISLIPLTDDHLKTIFKNLTTSRFIVKNGVARNYGSKGMNESFLPKLDVPDGCYEFINGTLYKVLWGGATKKLSKDHPLNQYSAKNTVFFYNLGIQFNTLFVPYKKYQPLIPSRYAYFKNDNLYLMGNVIFHKDDPTLIHFLQREYKKQSHLSSQHQSYHPFEDLGAPIDHNGNLDKELIRQYGLRIPSKMYLVLGDNHANSSDSRDFGFVPEDNLRGGANFIFWPPQKRFGRPFQPPYNWVSVPKAIVWSAAFLIFIICLYQIRKRLNRPLKF